MSVLLNRVVSSQYQGNTVKSWLSTFTGQPSLAALPVVVEDLDVRMRSQHVVGEERRRALQDGGCASRTGANGDRVQHVGISGSAAGAADQGDCMDLTRSAAAFRRSCRSCKLKEHSSLQRKELFSRGLRCCTTDACGGAAIEEPRPCVGECASARGLREGGRAAQDPVGMVILFSIRNR